MDRIKGIFDKLQEDGRIKTGGNGTGNMDEIAVAELLKKHDEEKLGSLRKKYVDKIPIRRQAFYREKDDLFVKERLTKLHVIS